MTHMMGDRSDQVHLHPEDAARLDRLAELLAPVHELAKHFLAQRQIMPPTEVETAATIPPPNTMTGD